MIDLRQLRVVESEYRQFCRRRNKRRQMWGLVVYCVSIFVLTAAFMWVVGL